MTSPLRGCLIVAGSSLLFFAGCTDPQAAQQQQVQAKLLQVTQLIEKANSGFITNPTSQDQTLASARAATLNDTLPLLADIVTAGSPVQKAQAAKLQSQILRSQAAYDLALAMDQWNAYWNHTSAVLAQVRQINNTLRQIDALQLDTTQGAKELQEYQTRFMQQAEKAQQDIAQINGVIATLTQKHAGLIAQRNQAGTQASDLRAQAFNLKGQEQFDVYQKALAAERQAQTFSAQAEEIASLLSARQGELAILQIRARNAKANADFIASRQQALETYTQDSAAQRQTLLTNQDSQYSLATSSKALADECAQAIALFIDKVDPAFAKADAQAQKAIAALKSAQGLDRNVRQAELLAAYALRLDIQSQWLATRAMVGRSLAVAKTQVEANPTLAQAAPSIVSQFNSFSSKTNSDIDAALAIKAETDELLGSPSAGPEASADPAGWAQTISDSLKQIEASKL